MSDTPTTPISGSLPASSQRAILPFVERQTSWIEQPLAWGLVTLLIAVIFAPLRNRLQSLADHLFYGGWYDYRSVVGEMSQAFSGIVDTDALAQLLVVRLAETLRLRGAALLLKAGEETLAVVKMIGWRPDEFPSSDLPRTSALAHELRRAARPLTTPELRYALMVSGSENQASLTADERSWLSFPEIELWVPLVHRERLHGVLLLSARAGEEPFETEDRRILATLAFAAAIAAENVHLFEELRRRANEVSQLYSQLVQIREAERKRLARELHDQVVQDLINLHYYLDADAPRLAPTAQEHAQAMREQMRHVINDLRQACTALRPAALDNLDLGLAMQGYVEEFMDSNGLNIFLQFPKGGHASTESLPEDVSLSLFRVLQESLTNVHRHAQASQVQVELAVDSDQVTMWVRDNGRGFQCPKNLGTLLHDKHFGLVGIRERMNLIGGTLLVESTPGQGTTLHIRAPLASEQ